MFKELEIMKTNIITNTTIMKTYVKYLCAVLLVICTSARAWGATYNKITSLASLKTGEYVIVGQKGASSWGRLIYSSMNDGRVSYTEHYTTSLPASITTTTASEIWTLTVSGTGDSRTVTIYNSNEKKYLKSAGKSSSWDSSSGSDFTVTYSSGFQFEVSSSYLGVNKDANWWRDYASTTLYNSNTYCITLYKKVTSPQTVTFNKGNGEFDDPSVFTNTNQITEASGGAGITLPLVNPTSSMSSLGWGFYGWATSAVSSPTTTAPTIVGKAGDTYYPESATTLYAVFAKGEYTLIKSTTEIESGAKYLIAGFDYNNDEMYVMTNSYRYDKTYSKYFMAGHLLGTSPSNTYSAADIYPDWRYIINEDNGKYYIKDNADTKYIDVDYGDWYTSTYYASDYYTFTIDGSNGYTIIKNNYSANKYLVLFVGGDFGQYTSSDPWDAMLIYKESEAPTYCSAPKTVRVVASPEEGGLVDLDIVSDQEYIFNDDDYEDFAEAAANSGYDFLRWETSNATNAKFYDGSAYTLTTTTEDYAQFKATGDATLTAYFYKHCSVTYTLTGLTKLTGTTTVDAATNVSGFTATFSVNDHYRTTPLTCSVTMGGSTLTEGSGKDYTWNASTKTLTFPAATDITGDLVITITAEHTEYTKYAFSCADLQLDEPDNGADNVLSDVIYLTSTNGQKVRSAAHFHVHGDGLTASQTVKFTTGDDDLDELYTFRKADGTEVATNSSGTVDEEVYIFYQPTATTDGRDLVTSVKAYVEKASASNNKPKAVVNEERTINGRHLPAQFIIAAKSGGVWYALPSDASVTGAQMGYTFTPDNATTPTKATVAPSNASYAIYAPTADATNKSYVRFAATSGNKALWSNNSSSKVGIKNNAVISGGSAKGNQYEWRLDNTAASAYKLWNNSANAGSGRFLGMDGTTWNMYAAGGAVVHDLWILPVDSWSDYIGLEATDWEETAFSFNITSGTPPTSPTLDHVQVAYNGNTYDASISESKLTITDDDFADAGGFTAAPGTQLIVEWCSASSVLAQGSLISPIIIKTNTVNLSDYDTDALVKTDIFVTNGAKLTVNENTTVHDVTVNAGSTLLVDKAGESTGATLTMSSGKLTLRGGWTTIGGDPKYDMPRVYINPLSSLAKTNTTINLYMDIFKSEDGKHYYPFAVPFAVAVNDVKYVDPTLAAAAVYNKHYVIKRYNGAKRAENGTGDGNWEVVPTGSILKPGEGYIITAVAVGGKAQLVVPMKNVTNSWLALGEQATVSDSTKNVIKVTAHTGTATAGGGANNRHKGWNMVGVPFMSCYTSGKDMYSGVGSADLMSGRMELSGDVSDPYAWETSDVVYVSVPTHDFSEYIQTDITTAQLVPGWSFFIQVGTTGNLTFLTTKQAESSSTPLYAPQRETSPIVKTGIVLTGGEKSDKTTLLISDKYSSDYEVGADLEKMFGNGFTLAAYSITNGTMLAFNAMSTEDAKQLIPIGVRLPADGEYTFALNSRYADADIERLDLIDYETGTVTNLLMSDYTFTATSCQNDERFALNVVTMQKVATGHDQLQTDVDGARKIIMDDKLFIIRDGLLYDATGKRVYNINK